MKLSGLWVESIAHFPAEIQESLLAEQPHTRVWGWVPPELSVLGGPSFLTDLGFENLGLSPVEFRALTRAFSGVGVRVPGTPWRLRNVRPFHTVVEPSDGSEEVELPSYWLDGVLVIGPDDKPVFSGSRVRPDQLGLVG